MSFQISDKVVCVNDSNFANKDIKDYDPIVEGLVYVVKAVSVNCHELSLQVVGAYAGTNPVTGMEHWWKASRFRKLSDVKAENAAKRRKKEPQP